MNYPAAVIPTLLCVVCFFLGKEFGEESSPLHRIALAFFLLVLTAITFVVTSASPGLATLER